MAAFVTSLKHVLRLSGISALLATSSLSFGGAGDHIKAGNAIIKPSLDLGVEFRTNVLQSPSDALGGPNLFVQPGFDIESKSANTDFSLTSLYTLRKHFQADLVRADRYTDFDLGTNLNLMRSSVIGFRLSDRASVRNDNNLQSLHTRMHNGLGAQMAIRPGPILELRLGGSWDYDRFLVPPSGLGQSGSVNPILLSQRNTVGPTFEAEWRFFPRTALFWTPSIRSIFGATIVEHSQTLIPSRRASVQV